MNSIFERKPPGLKFRKGGPAAGAQQNSPCVARFASITGAFLSCHLHRKCGSNPEGLPVRCVGGNFAAVGPNHRLGDGESDAVPAGFTVPGTIRPVESVEKVGDGFLLNLIHGIAHREENVFALTVEAEPDIPGIRRILECVVQEDAHQLAEGAFVAPQEQVLHHAAVVFFL